MTTVKAAPVQNALGDRIVDWWTRYCDATHRNNGAPGTRAELRRCRSAVDAATIPAAIALARTVGALRKDPRSYHPDVDVALNLARVLAHVRNNSSERPMQSAGWKSFPSASGDSDATNRPRLSENRFRRLLQVQGGEEQVAAFVRLIALTDGTMNVAAIGTDFLRWRDERTRQRWAFDYYAAAIATPQDKSTTTSSEDTDA